MAQTTDAIKDMMLGLGALEESLSRVAINRTLADAQSQVNQINASVVDEREKQMALSQLGQQLSMQMAQQGASASMIQETAGGLGPTAGALFQSVESRDAQRSSQQFQASESAKNRDLQRELAGMKQATNTKMQDRISTAKNWFVKNRAANEEETLKLLNSAESAYEEVGSTATTQGMYIRAILRGAGEARLDAADLGTIPYQSSKLRQLAQQFGIELTGEHPEAVTKFYRQVALAMAKENKDRMAKKLKGFAKSRAAGLGMTEEDLIQGLSLELNLDEQPADATPSADKSSSAASDKKKISAPLEARSADKPSMTVNDAIAAALRAPNDPKAKAFLERVRRQTMGGR